MDIRKDAFLAAMVALSLGATACGGSDETEETPIQDRSTGDEQPMMEEPAPEPEPAPAPMEEEPVAEEEYAPVTE
ncbi:MAG: hypothetical protein H6724_15640 [Sandaracinus sp.]|nr:hypothetical protein [Sandaracinus sp.]